MLCSNILLRHFVIYRHFLFFPLAGILSSFTSHQDPLKLLTGNSSYDWYACFPSFSYSEDEKDYNAFDELITNLEAGNDNYDDVACRVMTVIYCNILKKNMQFIRCYCGKFSFDSVIEFKNCLDVALPFSRTGKYQRVLTI